MKKRIVVFSRGSTDSTQSNKSILSILSVLPIGFVLLASAALGDTHSASVGVTVDTREQALNVSIDASSAPHIIISWTSLTGRQYRVNRCAQLGTGVYTTLVAGVAGLEPKTSFDDTHGDTAAFYWVEQEP